MTTVATLDVVVNANTGNFQSGMRTVSSSLSNVSSGLRNVGTNLSNVGSNISGVTLPLVAGFGLAINAALEFDTAMTNVNSILQLGTEDAAAMNAEILAIGTNSTFGANATAAAFYDIVGSVADAESRIPILNAAIATAEAGAADLGATVSVLTSSMNAYAMSAEDASYVSDVLTATVAAGVGSMDELAAALPNVTGLAASMGIGFDELGASMAYISTQGATFSEASTQLSGAINALMDPLPEMEAALLAIGYESGEAAIEALGLQGTFEALVDAGYEVGDIVGSIEGVRGVLALTNEGADDFFTNFSTGIEGATEAARAIQLEGAQAQMGMLSAAALGLAITIGTTLLNTISQLAVQLTPVIQSITDWVTANPELAGTIVTVVAAGALLGASLLILGPIVTALGAAFAVITSPLVLLAAGFAFLLSATGEMEQFTTGLGQIVEGVGLLAAGNYEGLWTIGEGLGNIVGAVGDAAFDGLVGLSDGIIGIIESLTGTDLPTVAEGWAALGQGLSAAWTAIETVMMAAQTNIQLFAATVQLTVASFIEELRNSILAFTGGSIDIAPTIEGDVAALTAQVETLTSAAINGSVGTGTANAEVTLTASVDSSSAQATISASVSALTGAYTAGNAAGVSGAPVADVEGGGTTPPLVLPSGATGVNVLGEGIMYVHANEQLLNAADTEVYRRNQSGGGGGGNTQIFQVQAVGQYAYDIVANLRRAQKDMSPG